MNTRESHGAAHALKPRPWPASSSREPLCTDSAGLGVRELPEPSPRPVPRRSIRRGALRAVSAEEHLALVGEVAREGVLREPRPLGDLDHRHRLIASSPHRLIASSPHRLIASFREQLQGGEDEALASPRRRAGFAEPRPNRRSARTGRRACFYGFLLRERWSAFSAPSTGGEGTTPCAGERTASHNGVAPSR